MSLYLNPFSVGYWMHGFAWREPKKSDEPVLSENANGAARSNPRGVLKTRGDQPTRHWLYAWIFALD